MADTLAPITSRPVVRSATAEGTQQATGPTAAQLNRLRGRIGKDDFYAEFARVDPQNAAKWRQMAQVQRGFKDAEAGYANPAARTYSESNRDTLHRAAIKLAENAQPGQDLYRDFIQLHPTVFRENGAFKLPPCDQLEVLKQTDPQMFNLYNSHQLAEGDLHHRDWKPLVQEAANETRAARREQGLPVTSSGYEGWLGKLTRGKLGGSWSGSGWFGR